MSALCQKRTWVSGSSFCYDYPEQLRRQLDRGLQSLPSLKLLLHFGGILLELALYLSGTLTDIHGLAHCNERGRARADTGGTDNGDNLRWRHVDCGTVWPSERHEKHN